MYAIRSYYDTIFAIGDIATMETEAYPHGHPMMAQPAIQQGQQLADNIIRLVNQKEMQPFKYKDKGVITSYSIHYTKLYETL